MMYPKRKPIRSKRLRNHANGQRCVRCGISNGTVVLCHYQGFRQDAYGKGRGQKCDDFMGAELCAQCHAYFDNPTEHKSVEMSEEFLHYIALTWRRWFDDGLLRIEGER